MGLPETVHRCGDQGEEVLWSSRRILLGFTSQNINEKSGKTHTVRFILTSIHLEDTFLTPRDFYHDALMESHNRLSRELDGQGTGKQECDSHVILM